MKYPNLAGSMKKYGVTQGDIAKHFDVVDSTVSYWLNDESEPLSVKNAREIKETFFPSLKFGYLFSLEPTEMGE